MSGLAVFIIAVFIIVLYFVPMIVAYKRNHRQGMAITVLNLFAGWTALGWIVALVWACTSDVLPSRPASSPDEIDTFCRAALAPVALGGATTVALTYALSSCEFVHVFGPIFACH
jgi:Superinfection immunity protein